MKTNYGKIIHEKRRSLMLTEEKLAEHSNMSPRHIRNIEKCSTIPKLDTVIKLGKSLGMNLGDLEGLKMMEENS